MTVNQAAAIAEVAREYLLDPPRTDDPVVELATPDELLQAFAEVAPLTLPDDVRAVGATVLAQAAELVVKYSVHTTHPRFFNQNFAGPDPVAVAGDWLGAALNTTNATFEAAPVFTLMETAALRKLASVAGWPDDGNPTLAPGMFAPGGSSATLYALQLARHRHQPDIARVGANGDKLMIFVSDAGHYAAVKSAALLGMGMDAVVKVESDDVGRVLPEALRTAIASARQAGQVPLCVIGTAGTTVTSAFDSLDVLADICKAEDLWLHVDGCYGGSALFSPAQRHHLDGIERADSFVWNLHKMMGITQQCTALLVRDPAQLAPCFATGATYIFQPDKLFGDYDSGDRHFQCARRVDVLKLWLSWHANGDDGFAARVDHAFAMAEHTRQRIANSDGEFATIVSGDFTNVVFTWVPPELRPFDLASLSESAHQALHELAPKIKAGLQQSGSALLGFQPVHGINSFRLLFMNPAVTTADVDISLDTIASLASSLWAEASS